MTAPAMSHSRKNAPATAWFQLRHPEPACHQVATIAATGGELHYDLNNRLTSVCDG